TTDFAVKRKSTVITLFENLSCPARPSRVPFCVQKGARGISYDSFSDHLATYKLNLESSSDGEFSKAGFKAVDDEDSVLPGYSASVNHHHFARHAGCLIVLLRVARRNIVEADHEARFKHNRRRTVVLIRDSATARGKYE